MKPREGEVILGLRPEHAALGDAGAWPLRVEVVEMLGAERLVYGKLGDTAFTLRLDGTLPPPKPGDTVHLQADAARLHWFDATSKTRL